MGGSFTLCFACLFVLVSMPLGVQSTDLYYKICSYSTISAYHMLTFSSASQLYLREAIKEKGILPTWQKRNLRLFHLL